MTTQQQAYALSLSDELLKGMWVPNVLQNESALRARAAQELRRLHAENESLKERVQELGKAARDVNSRRVQELEAQLAAVGAGGVEPLRKRECLHQISPEHSILGIFLSAMSDQLKIDGPAMRDAMLWYCGVQEIATTPQPAAQALDSVRVFWQQHTQADALSMTMAELHADVELVIRAARGAAQAAPVDAERLDYLQECGVTVEVLPGRPGWTFRIGGLHGTVHRSVRTAIDAARAAQEGK